jgi:4-alpha-glucanotransferase
VALGPLATSEWAGLLPETTLRAVVASRPGPPSRVAVGYALGAQERALLEALAAFRARSAGGDPAVAALARDYGDFRRANAGWLERDALYEVLRRLHDGREWSEWPLGDELSALDRGLWDVPPETRDAAAARRGQLLAAHAAEVEAFAFTQYLAQTQHRRLRERLARLSLCLFGDLQIGFSPRDAWFANGFLLRSHVMGAPPSRTNPEGQPWGYGVFDPQCLLEPDGKGGQREGPALRYLRARVARMFEDFDGVRVDHPHGLVCPWVYRAAAADPVRAVQQGARLYSSPDLADHPELARHAIARADQLDRSRPRHDDAWVRELTEEQVERYGRLFAVLGDEAARHGREARDLACEILSTQPYELGRVIARHGLGRFRVTQKADLSRADDVYRGENAGPEDWIMLGNHDTPPIWRLAEDWVARGDGRRQAEYLASRLLAPGEDRESWVAHTASDVAALAAARFAELFVGPARNVQVSFGDLLGLREPYNRPGTFGPDNWSQRVAPSFREDYEALRRAGRALDLRRALARAMRSRGPGFVAAHATLIGELERAE